MWLEAAFSEQGSTRIYCKNMHAHVQQISRLPLLPLYVFLKTQILSWVSIVKDSIVEELTLLQQAIGCIGCIGCIGLIRKIASGND